MVGLSSQDIIISGDQYNAEDANVCRHRGRPSKVDLAARRGRSMGRYPLKAAVEKYLERRRLQVGNSTLNNERRIASSHRRRARGYAREGSPHDHWPEVHGTSGDTRSS